MRIPALVGTLNAVFRRFLLGNERLDVRRPWRLKVAIGARVRPPLDTSRTRAAVRRVLVLDRTPSAASGRLETRARRLGGKASLDRRRVSRASQQAVNPGPPRPSRINFAREIRDREARIAVE